MSLQSCEPGRSRRAILAATTALAVGLVAGLSGCSSDEKDKGSASGSSSSAGADTVGTPSPEPTPETVKTAPALRKPLTFEDKVTVSIAGIKRTTVKATGPGSVAGQVTQFTLVFTNGSPKPLDLNTVQVLATYGAQRTEVSPAYVGKADDFAGVVAPGAKKSAVYGFEVPPEGEKKVTVSVTFEGKRRMAVFTGPIT